MERKWGGARSDGEGATWNSDEPAASNGMGSLRLNMEMQWGAYMEAKGGRGQNPERTAAGKAT